MNEDTTPLQQYLIDAGYKKHVSDSNKLFNHTDTLFQKCIKDDKGKKYFINMWYYPEHSYGGIDLPEQIQGEVQFTLQDGEHLEVISFYTDIAKIELQMEELWVKMGFGYYELNEDC